MCANHTLNLLVTVDAIIARNDSKHYNRLYDMGMAKVQAMSNTVHQSSKNNATEIITGITFINPTKTYWLSDIKCVVDIGLIKVNECQEFLKLEIMTEIEIYFLKSYLSVMKPLHDAINLLEKEEDSYTGDLISMVRGINKWLKRKSSQRKEILLPPINKGFYR